MSESSGVSVAPPGPRGYPLLGVFPSARKDPLGFFLESARTHGDVVALPFGMRRLYLLSHPDHIKYVLQEHDGLFQKGPAAARIKPLFGESLTTVDGDDWSRRRRLLRPAFQPQRLVAAVPTIAAMAEEMLGRWRSPLEHGRPLDVFAEMIGVTRAIILRILFGDVSEVDAWTVGQAFTTTAERVNRELWSPLGWLFRLLPSSARYDRAERCLDEFMTRRIDEARRRGPGRDLLSTMLAARDEETDGRFDDAALADELKALFVAGHTTTASGLAWVWYVLSQNSRARRRLQNEVRAVLGTRPPTADDLPALDYTRTVIEETLRLYPPTWVTARTTSRAVDIGEYHIPANVIVLLSPYVTHRDPRFWEDPDRFDPDRFSPGRGMRPRYAYFPFGGGPRACIGSLLALIEMQIIVAMVAQRYELTLAPGSRVDPHPGIVLEPYPGVRAILHPTGPGTGS